MHGLGSMRQMMFTKYLVVVDDGVNEHKTSEVLFRLRANTDPRRDSIFTKGHLMCWIMHLRDRNRNEAWN